MDNAFIGYSSWDGVVINNSQSVIATTWLGDVDLSGLVNSFDYDLWSLGATSGPGSYFYGGAKPEWIDGDFNYNGTVDSDDYGLWSNTLSTPGSNNNRGFNPNAPIVPQAYAAASPAAGDLAVGQGWPGSVPEPGSLALLMLTAVGFAVFRGLRRRQVKILACLAAAALLATPRPASAVLYLNAMVDPATPGYAANASNNGYTYTVNPADYNTTVKLDVYGLIQDAAPSQSADGLTKLAGNFYLSNQSLKGAVGFGSWGPQINTLASNPTSINNYSQFQWAPAWGGLALGGTSAADSNAGDWWTASEGTVNQTGGLFVGPTGGTQAAAGGAIGTEFYLGQLTISFSAYAQPASPPPRSCFRRRGTAARPKASPINGARPRSARTPTARLPRSPGEAETCFRSSL